MEIESFIQTEGVSIPLIHRGLSLKTKAMSRDKLAYGTVGCVTSVARPVYNHECFNAEVYTALEKG